ncbi:MAG: hemolysin family protein [Scrofimicrobium sp.]
MNPVLGLGITVILLLVNAFFVASEFAVTSSRRSAVEPLVHEQRRGAKQAFYALEHVSVMLAICQLGITVMSTSLGVIAEPAIAHLIEGPLVAIGAPAGAAHGVAFVIALLLVLFLHVVFGEMVPKNISISSPEKALLLLAPILVAFGKVLRPIVVGLDHTANWFLRVFGMEPKSEISATFTVEEVASIVELSREEGKLVDDLGLLTGTLEFTEETAGSLMVPLGQLTVLTEPVTPDSVEALVTKTGFSRFPVADDEGNLVGYVHLKDVLYATGDQRGEPLESWRIRELESVDENAEAESVLRSMQKGAKHMEAVTRFDSSAGKESVIGVLFLEDLLEELVGQVKDSLQRGIQ